MRSKVLSILVVAVFAVSVLGGSAQAWEKGSFKVNPGVQVREKWDSNIFYDPNDEKSDFITVITPSVMSEFGFGNFDKHKLRLNYKVDLGIFAEYDDQNYGNHDALGEVMFELGENYELTVSDRFLFTSSRAGTEFERRNLRKENTAKVLLHGDFNKVGFDIGYSNYRIDFHSDLLDAFDRYDNSGWATGYVQVMPKTKALVEFKYTNIQYDDATGRDGNAYRGMAGLKGELTPKIVGIAKAGYKYKKYEDSTNDDFSSAVAEIALMYDPMDRLNIIFGYIREGFESTYVANNYYTGDHFSLNVNYEFGKNWTAKGTGIFQHNYYPEQAAGASEKRRDYVWSVGGGLEYKLQEWMVLGGGYDFKQRESTIDDRDYDDHIIYTDVKMVF
ncbi:MAG: outer membrane beta-barrel protein [Candidatus Omnitrophica bacterium]|nr:outer membrane beta-barrel protein [Candidatus Omnitrophota bacterium]